MANESETIGNMNETKIFKSIMGSPAQVLNLDSDSTAPIFLEEGLWLENI